MTVPLHQIGPAHCKYPTLVFFDPQQTLLKPLEQILLSGTLLHSLFVHELNAPTQLPGFVSSQNYELQSLEEAACLTWDRVYDSHQIKLR